MTIDQRWITDISAQQSLLNFARECWPQSGPPTVRSSHRMWDQSGMEGSEATGSNRVIAGQMWWAHRDSNPGPLPCKGSALAS